MSNKPHLETLARTLLTAFLCLAVVSVGTNATAQPETKVAAKEISKAKLKKLTRLEITKTTTTSRSRVTLPASKTPAPKSVEKRKVWLKALLKEAGFKGKALKTAWAVAMKESTGRPKAYNGNRASGDHSYGIFQINMIGNLGADRRAKFGIKSNTDLFNPLTNAKAAYYMSDQGTNWYSWDITSSGYNGGVSKTRFQEWLTQYPKG